MTISKANVQSVLKPTVMVGGLIVAAGAAVDVFNKVSKKTINRTNWIMPAITIMIGVSAFTYAVSGAEIKVLPA